MKFMRMYNVQRFFFNSLHLMYSPSEDESQFFGSLLFEKNEYFFFSLFLLLSIHKWYTLIVSSEGSQISSPGLLPTRFDLCTDWGYCAFIARSSSGRNIKSLFMRWSAWMVRAVSKWSFSLKTEQTKFQHFQFVCGRGPDRCKFH